MAEVLNLRLLHANHLYWPDLDIDLGLEVLDDPDKFRLMVPLMGWEKTVSPFFARNRSGLAHSRYLSSIL